MDDWRNIRNGTVIPTLGMQYCDQPYVVRTEDDNWVCIITLGTLGETVAGSVNFSAATVSGDRGETWSDPVRCHEMGYAVPLSTSYGRLYAIRPPGSFTYSDDGGETWSEEREIAACPDGWTGWGVSKPVVANGSVFVPWARTDLSDASAPRKTEVYFYRSDNVLAEEDPDAVRWELLPAEGRGLRGPEWDAGWHISEEPHVVGLGDGTLYCVFRTDRGYICYATSDDNGDTWTTPEPLTYSPDGDRIVRNPLACPSLWKCSNGRYLLWFHNHAGRDYTDRNPAWISGGREQHGEIRWSEPEVLLYSDDLTRSAGRLSYPGLLEYDGDYWIFETQKTTARVHQIDPELLCDAWEQRDGTRIDREDVCLELEGEIPNRTTTPSLPRFREETSNEPRSSGFAVNVAVRFDSLVPGQRILDSRDDTGRGFCLRTTSRGTVEAILRDRQTENRWDADRTAIETDRVHEITFIADGGPDLLVFLVDGQFCDGGGNRQFGWGRFSTTLRHCNGGDTLRIAPDLDGTVEAVRWYDRGLTISEAVMDFVARHPDRA